MPRSTNANLSPETVQELESQFYNFIDSLTSDERKAFFAEFLTNEEKMMMYKRLALYWSLLEGYPLARIQEMIGVTHDTTRVYNKKKNDLSPEFKALVGRITSQVMNKPSEEKPQEESRPAEDTPEESQPQGVVEEVTVMEEVFVRKNEDGNTEIIREDIEIDKIVLDDANADEPVDGGHEQRMDEGEKHEEEVSPEPTYDQMHTTQNINNEEEKHEEVKHDEDKPHEPMHADSHDETPHTQDQDNAPKEIPQEQKEQSTDNKDEDDDEGEKSKSGFKKFFGF